MATNQKAKTKARAETGPEPAENQQLSPQTRLSPMDESNTKGKPPRHGIYTWVRHGQLPSIRGKRKVHKILEELEAGLIADYGGTEGISTSQEILIRSTVKVLGVPFLIELFINKYGPVIIKEKGIELHPILSKNYLAFFNTIRQNLLALKELGKDKTDEALAPYEVIEREKKREKNE